MFRIFLSINSSFLKTQRLIWLLHKANTYAWSFWGRSTSGSSTISSSLNTALGNPIRNRVNPISNPSFNSMLEFMHSDGRHFSDDPQKYPRGGQDIHFTCPLVTLFHFTVPLLVLLLLLVPKLLLKLCSPEELYLYPILIKKPLDTWHKKYYLILHESFNHMSDRWARE